MDKEKQDVKDNFALVTGAGAGLGYAFASEMAKRGFNIILVSLPGEDLAGKALTMSGEFKVNVRTYETDLSLEANCLGLHEWVEQQGLQVTVLINNAGIGSTNPFLDFKPGFYTKQILVNIMAPVLLCRLFIPTMIENKKESLYPECGKPGRIFPYPQQRSIWGNQSLYSFFYQCTSTEIERNACLNDGSLSGPGRDQRKTERCTQKHEGSR